MNYYDILLAKKLEDDRDPKVEGLSVTQNGTYSEEGKVYKPVIVNVEGYRLKNATAGNIVSFSDGADDMPLNVLVYNIVAVQSGNGDPSPRNIRPISGWDNVTITNKDDLDNPTETKTLTISLGQTVYGGYLNISTGLLTITHILIEKTWGEYTSKTTLGNYKRGTISLAQRSVRNDPNAICNIAPWFLNYTSDTLHFYVSEQSANVFLPVDTTNDTVIQIRYELATPQTYQLTPAQVRSIAGYNNIFVNCGDITSLEYFTTL